INPEELTQIIQCLAKEDSLAATRDSALIQIGFFGALRRSELVAIQHEHIKWDKAGIEILLPQSKTDQLHEGQYCAIPYGNTSLCPIKALEGWLAASQIKTGPLFRRIIRNKTLSDHPLTALSVNHIIHRCA